MGWAKKPAFFVTLRSKRVTSLSVVADKKQTEQTDKVVKSTAKSTATAPMESKAEALITPALDTLGYELVRVQVLPQGRSVHLQIMAERVDQKPMTVDDCATITRAIEETLDSDEALADRAALEVSSPGIDRPLTRLKDYTRFQGHIARVDLSSPMDGALQGHRRFQGKILRVVGDGPAAIVEFHTETGDKRVPVSKIARARLVLTDALLAAHAAEVARAGQVMDNNAGSEGEK